VEAPWPGAQGVEPAACVDDSSASAGGVEAGTRVSLLETVRSVNSQHDRRLASLTQQL
jgi:hypothetical protein